MTDAQMGNAKSSSDRHGLLAKLDEYMEQHYAERIRVADLARICHVSVRTLWSRCMSHYGEAPLNVIRRYRLTKLYEAILSSPWTSLSKLNTRCGLCGGKADQDLFQTMFDRTIKQHQMLCRGGTSAAVVNQKETATHDPIGSFR